MNAFQIATVRPPTENFSLAINTHSYCPWGKCAFCPGHLFEEELQFKRRTLEEVINDINNARDLNHELLNEGPVNQASMFKVISKYQNLNECVLHLAYWHLYTNATTAFLGGANPLLYKKEFLTGVLSYLKATFPSIKRITSYGRTRTASKKKNAYFKALHEEGLDRIHVGLESGSDKVLEFINKGVTSEQHILGGSNIKQGGISLCSYVMPGLGGKKWSEEHALETARVINELEPDFVRLRTLEIFPKTPLHQKLWSGEFEELKEEEVVKEERLLVENIECETTITSDSAANLLTDIWGDLPRDKNKILRVIDNYLDLDSKQKIEFSLKRRGEAFSSQYGGLSSDIIEKIEKLKEFSSNNDDYYAEMAHLIRFIRAKLIP
ncbi:MAG: radical SAM protein [Candidatus Lokiarchaeota archaeon]|nr:radical SAM protein [Candidatus Lokiarchaeota archaeon]